jgi:hypothetical protein
MLCDTDILVSWRARPGSFVALMGLYESNHVRFLRLAGDPAQLSGTMLSHVPGDCDLQLSVVEHMPYTSALELTYLLPADAAASSPELALRMPNLRLRAYHDARLLEVECSPPPATGRAGLAERELRQRWARNMMLNKWLEYCAECGHRFVEQRSSG